MKRFRFLLLALSIAVLASSCSGPMSEFSSTEEKLRTWQRGVWLSDGGAYTVWTDSHYLVVSAVGDSLKANIYCGSSRIRYTDKGVARSQNVRLREMPGKAREIHTDFSMYEPDGRSVSETPFEIDVNMFEAGICNIVEGVIYDSVTEETPFYIILSTCNGYRTKLYNDGRSLFISPDGHESWSFRLETW